MKTSVAHATAAVSLAALLMLSGCSLLPRIPNFGDDNSSSNNSQSDNDSDNNSDDNSDEIEDNPFLDNVVPEGFPSEVPLPDLEIYLGLRATEDSWSIIYKSDDLEDDYNDIVSSFEADGWTVQMNNASDDGSLGVFVKEPYTVQVIGVPDGSSDFDGPGISFTVVRSN